ncbi:MAG: hypothetical protein K8H90_05060, partial [Thermoanaerobaculia bacterium]|nr:hypothetical protein [Thermoanaerobaculia bacterium]
MTAKFLLSGLTALALAAAPAFAAEPSSERFTVPLSDPSRPAHLEVSLVMGGIAVIGGGAAREVVIEALARPGDDDEPG